MPPTLNRIERYPIMELYIATSAAAIALILYQNYKINDLDNEVRFQFYTLTQVAKDKIELKFDPADGGLWVREKE